MLNKAYFLAFEIAYLEPEHRAYLGCKTVEEAVARVKEDALKHGLEEEVVDRIHARVKKALKL